MQAELSQKVSKVLETELQSRGVILGDMAQMLRSSFLLAKGHGYVSETMTKDYYNLVHQLQAPCSVSWEDDADPQMGSGDSKVVVAEDESNRTKRKLVDSVSSSSTSLDNTFTMDTVRPRGIHICAEQLMAKGGLAHGYFSAVAVEILHTMFTSYVMIMSNE